MVKTVLMCLVMTKSVFRVLPRISLKMGLRQVEEALLFISCQIMLAYWNVFSMIHKFFGPHHFEKSSNMAKKNEIKPCSTCFKPISPWYFRNPGYGFLLHDPSLKTSTWVSSITELPPRDCLVTSDCFKICRNPVIHPGLKLGPLGDNPNTTLVLILEFTIMY